jgi:DNA repair exonuclease SbcCD ATPase subunit
MSCHKTKNWTNLPEIMWCDHEKKRNERKYKMKREFLENMGLEKEKIDSILDENSKDIGKAKQDYETMKQELETTKNQLQEANTTIDKFGDYEEIKGQVSEYKQKYEASEAEKVQIQQNYEFNGKLESVAKKYGARALKAILPYLDMETLKQSKNQDNDIEEAFKSLKESDESAFLFGSSEPIKNPVGSTNSGGGDSTLAAMRAAAGLPPEK